MRKAIPAIACAALIVAVGAARAERARDLGIELDGVTGPLDAITDVAGVEVGHVTLISGEGALRRGVGPVRTGVTAVLPRGKTSTTPVFAAWETGNAAGEMTGTVWLEERGLLDGPIMITNTHSVGVVRDAAVEWLVDRKWAADWFTPLVAETYDGALNDVNGFHVKREHALQALASASSGPVAEGSVGGGTGMICSQFKGGIGTASRVVDTKAGRYTVGALVQCNYGARERLRVAGVPVGRELKDRYLPCTVGSLEPGDARWAKPCDVSSKDAAPMPKKRATTQRETGAVHGAGPVLDEAGPRGREGSIIVVLATDAPLLPHQLKRLAKRPAMAQGRLGDIGGEGSGDIYVAFSTANPDLQSEQESVIRIEAFPNPRLTQLFEAAVQATEEAILNAMLAAQTMTGRDGMRVYALPHDELRVILAKYRRAPLNRTGGSATSP